MIVSSVDRHNKKAVRMKFKINKNPVCIITSVIEEREALVILSAIPLKLWSM